MTRRKHWQDFLRSPAQRYDPRPEEPPGFRPPFWLLFLTGVMLSYYAVRLFQ